MCPSVGLLIRLLQVKSFTKMAKRMITQTTTHTRLDLVEISVDHP